MRASIDSHEFIRRAIKLVSPNNVPPLYAMLKPTYSIQVGHPRPKTRNNTLEYSK